MRLEPKRKLIETCHKVQIHSQLAKEEMIIIIIIIIIIPTSTTAILTSIESERSKKENMETDYTFKRAGGPSSLTIV